MIYYDLNIMWVETIDDATDISCASYRFYRQYDDNVDDDEIDIIPNLTNGIISLIISANDSTILSRISADSTITTCNMDVDVSTERQLVEIICVNIDYHIMTYFTRNNIDVLSCTKSELYTAINNIISYIYGVVDRYFDIGSNISSSIKNILMENIRQFVAYHVLYANMTKSGLDITDQNVVKRYIQCVCVKMSDHRETK
jgi:hypothetical protein